MFGGPWIRQHQDQNVNPTAGGRQGRAATHRLWAAGGPSTKASTGVKCRRQVPATRETVTLGCGKRGGHQAPVAEGFE